MLKICGCRVRVQAEHREKRIDLRDIVPEFRKLLRTSGILSASRTALAKVSSESGIAACKLLFNRIDTANLHEEMRLTPTNLRMICDDLGIHMNDPDLEHAVLEMDHVNRNFVTYRSFEEWWKNGARHTGGNESYNSGELRSMLRIGGLLTSETTTVASVLQAARSIVEDHHLLDEIEVALDQLARNSDEDIEHILDSVNQGIAVSVDESKNMVGMSLGFLAPESVLRGECDAVVHSRAFEIYVLFCIIVNLAVLVAFANVRRTDSESSTLDILDWANNVLGGMFTLEMVMRIIAQGFVRGDETYLQDWWNRFDFGIILAMWSLYALSVFTGLDRSISFTVAGLRSFRALRFFQGTRDIMTTLGVAANTILMVAVGLVVAGMMFAIVGRELFGGSLTRTCNFNNLTANHGAHEMAVEDEDFEIHGRRLSGGGAPDWYTTVPTTHCPTAFSCNKECFIVQPVPGPKDREHHVDKYGFDTMAPSMQTVFSLTALDEWMHISSKLLSYLTRFCLH
jgi:hypothetical protein